MLIILAVLSFCSFFSSSMALFALFLLGESSPCQSVDPVSYGFNLSFLEISTHAYCIDDCYGLVCGPPNSYVEAITLVPQNVTELGDRAFKEMMKLA